MNTEPARTSAPTGPFSATLWAAAQPVYRAILDLPFNRELTAGTLDPATFAFYICQDSLYFLDFARALAVTDRAARQASDGARERMMAAFVTSARLEWMFWDSAYRLETWPP